jgi:hypothetical protein
MDSAMPKTQDLLEFLALTERIIVIYEKYDIDIDRRLGLNFLFVGL